MTEIKKRPHWNMCDAPKNKKRPVKPEQTILKDVVLTEFGEYGSASIGDLQLPEGAKYEDIRIDVDHCRSYHDCDSCDVTVTIKVVCTKPRDNPDYNSQLKKYKADLAKWNANAKLIKEEIEEWKIWKDQEIIKELQSKIEQSQKLLDEKLGKK